MSRDVMVLGAGMVGVGTALALQTRGYAVTLLDRALPGSETSYGNAGFIQGEAFEPYALPRDLGTLFGIALKRDNSVDWDFRGLWRMAPSLFSYWRNSASDQHRRTSLGYAPLIRRALGDHARWIAQSGADNLIRREGYRLIFRGPAAFERQVRKAEKWNEIYGARFTAEDCEALARAEPALQRRLAGAIHWHDTWTCSDPGALVKAYVSLFEMRGGLSLDAEFRSLQPRGAGWEIASSAGMIRAEEVVVALGPWSPEALSPLGYRVNMIRKRGYHMNVHYPAEDSSPRHPELKTPLIDADMGAVYAPMSAGLRICTGADLSARPVVAVPRQLKRAYLAARELLDLGAPLDRPIWAGARPCMPDMVPLVGAAPRHRGLWFNFGHGHQGFTLGPTTGELLASVMAGDRPALALPLAPSRSAI